MSVASECRPALLPDCDCDLRAWAALAQEAQGRRQEQQVAEIVGADYEQARRWRLVVRIGAPRSSQAAPGETQQLPAEAMAGVHSRHRAARLRTRSGAQAAASQTASPTPSTGPYMAGSVGPKMTTVGAPQASARWVAPLSLPT
jgi:hypothetical protein